MKYSLSLNHYVTGRPLKIKLKFKLIFFLLLFGQFCNANMSSPILEGTFSSSAISSKDINILSETILIKIDKEFKTAKFIVEYNIYSDISGKQIPLLFHAEDFKDNFFVWIDNKVINVQNIGEKHFDKAQFSGLSGPLQKQNSEDEITIYWNNDAGNVYKISDLKYFETDIEKGYHKVRVEYIAKVWTDISGWIKTYSFRYSLAPAKYWKSFGNLDIIVEQDGPLKQLATNLGQPNEREIRSKNTWSFKKLPGDFFEVSYTATPSNYAKILLSLQPFGLFIIATILLAIFHLYLVLLYRRKNITRKYSFVVIVGSIIVPLLSLLSYMYSYDLIDNAIGENAGRYHGYVFLILILYPIFLIVYWLLLWLIDRFYKRKLIATGKTGSPAC